MNILTDCRRCKMNRQSKELTKAMLSTIASLVLSVKNIVIEYQTKLFPFAKAFLGLCLSGLLLVSCASGQKRAGNIWWADYTQNSRGNCSIDGQNLEKYWFNDTKSKTYGYQIPHGEHNVGIGTRWSNGFEDSTQLTFDVKEGRKYTFHTYELKEGQDPNAPVVLAEEYQEQTYTGNVGGAFLKDVGKGALQLAGATALVIVSPFGVVYGSPIWVPLAIYGYYEHNKKLKGAAKGPPDDATNTEAQLTGNMTETLIQPLDSTSGQHPGSASAKEAKLEETMVATISLAVEPPPVPTARPFDGCCYVWIEDADTREVVAGTRLPGAGK
jgi:hypothetical protein